MTDERLWIEQPWPAWEAHWLCDDSVESMCKTLGGIEYQGGPHLSRRKLRLFAAACVRRIQHVFNDQRNRSYISTVEEFAEGLITEDEISRRWGQLADPPNRDAPTDPDDPNYPYEDNPVDCACTALGFAGIHRMYEQEAYLAAIWAAHAANDEREPEAHVSLLRCIFGNPFRPFTLDPSHRTPTVTALAQAIYDERRFDDLPILADALEESGCTNADILNHLRGPGPHAKGCWPLDLVLDKQ